MYTQTSLSSSCHVKRLVIATIQAPMGGFWFRLSVKPDLSVWLSLYRIWIDLPWQGLAATPVTKGFNLVFVTGRNSEKNIDQKPQQIKNVKKRGLNPWNHRYIYLTYWPARMRHFLIILRHKCRILLFEYVNMIAQNIHIQLLEYELRPPKIDQWIGVSIL